MNQAPVIFQNAGIVVKANASNTNTISMLSLSAVYLMTSVTEMSNMVPPP